MLRAFGICLIWISLNSRAQAQEPAEAVINPRFMVVNIPVADLRKEPKAGLGRRRRLHEHLGEDSLQESQLLFGEKVLAFEENDGWVRVEAVEQEEYTHDSRWQGYPGWVLKNALVEVKEFPDWNGVVAVSYAPFKKGTSFFSGKYFKLSMGSRLEIIPAEHPKKGRQCVRLPDSRLGWIRDKDIVSKDAIPRSGDELRSSIVRTARSFIGGPYFWGGRSFFNKKKKGMMTGVDCSGLVNLSYRVHNIDLPRDSHEQFLKSRKISASELKPADLIFLAPREDPEHFSHVMMYAGEGKAIEAFGENKGVIEVDVEKRLGAKLESLGMGAKLELWRVYFGTYLRFP
ncbi:MAG: C40 family peptidase [Elusimicrobia bacterium]|nr:C40 family peptidase [Elusimicrobiota bacterium]